MVVAFDAAGKVGEVCSVCGQIVLNRHSFAVDHVSFEFEGFTMAGVVVIGAVFTIKLIADWAMNTQQKSFSRLNSYV